MKQYQLIIFDWEGTLAYPGSYSPPFNDRLYDGVAEMVERLRSSGKQIAIATGKGRESLNRATEKLLPNLVYSRTPDECANKPEPEMIFELMAEVNISPEQTLMVGDTPADLLMAKSAGVDSIAISNKDVSGYAPYGLEPIACFKNVLDLEAFLTGEQHG